MCVALFFSFLLHRCSLKEREALLASLEAELQHVKEEKANVPSQVCMLALRENNHIEGKKTPNMTPC